MAILTGFIKWVRAIALAVGTAVVIALTFWFKGRRDGAASESAKEDLRDLQRKVEAKDVDALRADTLKGARK